jgi:hypothetical protein
MQHLGKLAKLCAVEQTRALQTDAAIHCEMHHDEA